MPKFKGQNSEWHIKMQGGNLLPNEAGNICFTSLSFDFA
jgi:hypothetical protein